MTPLPEQLGPSQQLWSAELSKDPGLVGITKTAREINLFMPVGDIALWHRQALNQVSGGYADPRSCQEQKPVVPKSLTVQLLRERERERM